MARNIYSTGTGSGVSGSRSIYSLPSLASAQEEKDDGGFMGLGVDLGVTTLFKEIGAAVPALGQMVLPDWGPLPDGGPGIKDLGKGMGASLVGTFGATPAKIIDWGIDKIPGDYLDLNLEDNVEGITSGLWGEQFKAQDFFERADERGIVPALVEDVGNVAIAGSAAKGLLKAGSLGARGAGATNTAARLTALAESPLLRTLEHPYLSAASKVRSRLTAPAQASLLRHFGVDAPPASELAGVTDDLAGVADDVSDLPPPPHPLDEYISGVRTAQSAQTTPDGFPAAGGFAKQYDAQLPQGPGVQYLDMGDGDGLLGIRGDDGALQGYLQHTGEVLDEAGDVLAPPAVGIFQDLTGGGQGMGQRLLDAAADQGLDVPRMLANSEFTDAGRGSALKWLEAQKAASVPTPVSVGTKVADTAADAVRAVDAPAKKPGRLGQIAQAVPGVQMGKQIAAAVQGPGAAEVPLTTRVLAGWRTTSRTWRPAGSPVTAPASPPSSDRSPPPPRPSGRALVSPARSSSTRPPRSASASLVARPQTWSARKSSPGCPA